MSLRERTRQGLGIVEPCLPSSAKVPPSGSNWIHKIKHDGFRIIAHRSGDRVQLVTRAGNNFASRFPLRRQPGASRRSCRVLELWPAIGQRRNAFAYSPPLKSLHISELSRMDHGAFSDQGRRILYGP